MKRILHRITSELQRGLLFAAMLLLAFGAMRYLQGYFDFTFVERVPIANVPGEFPGGEPDPDIKRPADTDNASSGSDTQTKSPEESQPSQGVDSDSIDDTQGGNVNQGTTSPTTPIKKPQTAQRVSASLQKTKELLAKGYTFMTSGTFEKGKTVLGNADITGLGTSLSYSDYEVRTTKTTEYARGCIVTEETTKTEQRPAVLLRNGFIIRDVNGKLSLLRPDGSTVLSDYDESVFRLTELRDRDGNALFASVQREMRDVLVPIMKKQENSERPIESGFYEEEPVKTEVEVLTYYILTEDGKWVKSDYTDEYPHAESDMGLSFDAPLDYGKSDCDIVRYTNGYRWGYMSESTGRALIYPQFTRAYNFHDGYAVAFDEYSMYVIDEAGTFVYTVGYAEPEVFTTFFEVTLPDTNGIEALGTYYFSHGLTRVRFRENLYNYRKYNYIKSDDRSVLYDIHGKEFPIPSNYTLIAYSDGILLLQNQQTKLYGCMNYKGAWIVQPQYSYVTPSLSGLIAVGDIDGKKGLCDTNGSWVLPQVYDAVSAPSAGMIAVYDKTIGWEVYRMMTKTGS
ncbi:MAG: WG repeat-containing protein [Clostridia bacterium]|nr:WG repeat-containing protein [Clostridia bacterium]